MNMKQSVCGYYSYLVLYTVLLLETDNAAGVLENLTCLHNVTICTFTLFTKKAVYLTHGSDVTNQSGRDLSMLIARRSV